MLILTRSKVSEPWCEKRISQPSTVARVFSRARVAEAHQGRAGHLHPWHAGPSLRGAGHIKIGAQLQPVYSACFFASFVLGGLVGSFKLNQQKKDSVARSCLLGLIHTLRLPLAGRPDFWLRPGCGLHSLQLGGVGS